MTRATLIAVALLVCLPVTAVGMPLRVPDKVFAHFVSQSAKRGVVFLRKHQTPEGAWHHVGQQPNVPLTEETIGTTALCALALLENGVDSDDPALVKATWLLRGRVKELTSTHAIALSLQFLDRMTREDDGTLRMLGAKLLQGQHRNDIWGAHCPPLPGEMEDGRSTYLAIWSLYIARRHGVIVDQALQTVEKRFRSMQAADGSWTWPSLPGAKEQAGPTLACVGLLALAHGYREEVRPRIAVFTNEPVDPALYLPPPALEPQVRKACEYLARCLSVAHRPQHFDPDFLWMLERICWMYGKDKLQGVHCHGWGAKALIGAQARDGSWSRAGTTEVNTATAWALLFLSQYPHEVIIGVCEFPLGIRQVKVK